MTYWCLPKRNIITKTTRVCYYCLLFTTICFLFITVAISFDKYRSVHPALCEVDEFDDDDIDSGDDEQIPQRSPNNTHASGSGKKRRAKRSTETTPTKHDPYVCGRRNVRNMEKVVSTMLAEVINIFDIIVSGSIW